MSFKGHVCLLPHDCALVTGPLLPPLGVKTSHWGPNKGYGPATVHCLSQNLSYSVLVSIWQWVVRDTGITLSMLFPEKGGSGHLGYLHIFHPHFWLKGLIFEKYVVSALHMEHTKEDSQYCPICATWNGQIYQHFMTDPWIYLNLRNDSSNIVFTMQHLWYTATMSYKLFNYI